VDGGGNLMSNTSLEYLEEKILENFRKAVENFYKKEQLDYIKEFKSKIKHGEIDVDDYENELDVAREIDIFLKDQPIRINNFIKKYVQEINDNIFDSLKEKVITREEAEYSFNTLKHLLIAGKIYVESQKK
jgi:phage anti-repressor protein